MNKYFLSLLSILILFQSFKVWDEISHKKDKDLKKGGEIKEEGGKVEKLDSISNEFDIDILFNSANIDTGKKIAKQCSTCHDLSNNLKIKIGPPLWGVIGRKVGVIDDFKYSDAFKKVEKDWTRQELFYFLEDPKNYIIGTKMVYKGLKKPIDRANLISYLKSLK